MQPSDRYLLLVRNGYCIRDAQEITRELEAGGDLEGALEPLTEADLDAMWVTVGGEG